jgi:antitoxin HicB
VIKRADETLAGNSGGRRRLCVHFKPEPEGGFTVTYPRLPPVVAYGETLEKARENAREAIELYLAVIKADGQPIPPPDHDLRYPLDQLAPGAISST